MQHLFVFSSAQPWHPCTYVCKAFLSSKSSKLTPTNEATTFLSYSLLFTLSWTNFNSKHFLERYVIDTHFNLRLFPLSLNPMAWYVVIASISIGKKHSSKSSRILKNKKHDEILDSARLHLSAVDKTRDDKTKWRTNERTNGGKWARKKVKRSRKKGRRLNKEKKEKTPKPSKWKIEYRDCDYKN